MEHCTVRQRVQIAKIQYKSLLLSINEPTLYDMTPLDLFHRNFSKIESTSIVQTRLTS